MRITHNLLAFNAENNLKMVTSKKDKITEKLSSGYRINRAADDAAGLSISENMRRLIRGLNQGAENATDGISWTQIGDGALDSAHSIIHRMTELTIQALNGTNTDDDRMALEYEFEQLQSELDRISDSAAFNEIPIFEQHDIPYYQCEGDVKWDPNQMHVVTDGKNDLTFTYRKTESDAPVSVTFTIPAGQYTTQELIDEIDNLTSEYNKANDVELVLEFDQKGYCQANLEGGEVLDSVTGNMSYLLYQMFRGGGYGALIGTTSFPNAYSELEIVTGENDYLKFTIQDLQGPVEEKEVTIPAGFYTKQDLIDFLNQELASTTVRADAYGEGIRLSSEDAVVTGFKGNMFKIDGNGVIHNSVFYDNVKYGEITQYGAGFSGGYVLPTDSRDQEHAYYEINSTNNQLTLQPSNFDSPVTLTIPDGKYTASAMATKLRELFNQNGINTISISVISKGGFQGLKFTATDKGLDSKIQMDDTCSAYDTLFCIKNYNSYEVEAKSTYDTKQDKTAYFRGSKDLTQLSSSKPLEIVQNQNDKFKIVLNGSEYTITLDAGVYNSADEVVAQIDKQLNGANAKSGYKGMLSVTLDNGRLKLSGTGMNGQGTEEILNVTAEGQNTGYKDIFQGYNVTTQGSTASGTGQVTLNTPYDGNIGADENQMTITVDGVPTDITLPAGNVSQDEIKAIIEGAMQSKTIEIQNTFDYAEATGTTENRNFQVSSTGTATVASWSETAQGSSDKVEGKVETSNNQPAVLKIEVSLKNSMTVGDDNNEIALTIKDRTEVITLDNGVYTPETLKDTLQQKIDEVFGTGLRSATVTLDGNYLVLTARLQPGEDGRSTKIGCGTDSSSFLKELATTRTAAQIKSKYKLNSSMTITADNKEFIFQYTKDGVTNNIALSLTEGETYTPSTLVQAMNNQLIGTGVSVSCNSDGYLYLTSDIKGNNISISYDTSNGGSSAETLFGTLIKEGPARIVADRGIQNRIVIDAGVNDEFKIKVNGTEQSVILDAGTYNSSAAFLTMLQGKLSGLGVNVSLDASNRLVYETTAKGSGASLAMSFATGGNSMEAIYGKSQKVIPAVEVSFDNDGKLQLSTMAGNPSSKIKVSSANGGPFQQETKTETLINVTKGTGYHSARTSKIEGERLGGNGNILIDQWNNTLEFSLYDNGTKKEIQMEIPDGVYDYNQLQTKLNELIAAKAGAGKITVTVDADGVKLETTGKGYQNRMVDFKGDFYDKVIGRVIEQRDYVDEEIIEKEGRQLIDSAFTVGRKDVKNTMTKIQGGISDELKIDLTYGQNTYTLSMKLDSGTYSGEQLKNQLQKKINEQLVANGLPENLIEVGIGGINTGVYGANDENALNFSLSKTITAPSSGKFLIDGVSGSAAFEIFYQTDGSLEQAYIVGTKDIGKGIEVKAGEDELSILVDNVAYDITLTQGSYSADEFKDMLNAKLQAENAPVKADIIDGKLKLIHRKMGQHEIRDVSGTASDNVFFSENGRKTAKDDIYVKLSSSLDKSDKISLVNPIFNTCYLKLNSVCISKEKYAAKALKRLKEALNILSGIRSDFGSVQNRLEHALRQNRNVEENIQASESKIRDNDMANGMVALSNHNILQQAGHAVLAQANQSQQEVLALLS